ncbi:MAG: Gfo/Idh/MocA family oxidoreductase, partial [Sphaerospermopsis sp. SIO1G1]|nr:Gfo/Idh/MocA family oxidoreductase [Sphaerospermopsis sp. SIO1G1]
MTQAFSVIGVQHGHCHDMVRQLTGAGAKLVSVYEPDGERANRLIASYPDALAVSDPLEILDNPDVSVVVLAVLPRERASLAIEVLRAGKHVLFAKPAALSMKELADVEAAQFASNRLWTVFYSEHFLSEATRHAVSLCHEGRLGQLRHLIFSAPHQLKPETRPEWFFDKARAGGILADLLTHQTQQLLSITKAKTARLTHSRIERKDLLQTRQFEIAGE